MKLDDVIADAVVDLDHAGVTEGYHRAVVMVPVVVHVRDSDGKLGLVSHPSKEQVQAIYDAGKDGGR